MSGAYPAPSFAATRGARSLPNALAVTTTVSNPPPFATAATVGAKRSAV